MKRVAQVDDVATIFMSTRFGSRHAVAVHVLPRPNLARLRS